MDINDDGVIDEKDKVCAGSYQPKYFFGLNGTINWKKFDWVTGYIWNMPEIKCTMPKKVYGMEAIIILSMMLQITAGSREVTKMNNPRAFNGTAVPTDYFVEDGSFIRINNITMGYSFSTTKWKSPFEKLRIYASAQNPILFTTYTGFTPEMPGSPLASGIELNIYPVSATYLVGVNLQFR